LIVVCCLLYHGDFMPEDVQAAVASIKTKENNVNTSLAAGLPRAMEVPRMGGAMKGNLP